jgi:hypothetical protein
MEFKYYNDLIEPKNPKYPWVAEAWQVLCYYCAEPIFYEPGKAEAVYKQRVNHKGAGWHHYTQEGPIDCDPSKVRPVEEIDPPRCHICGAKTKHDHLGICSFHGDPVIAYGYTATTMDAKEAELVRYYGYDGKSGFRGASFQ